MDKRILHRFLFITACCLCAGVFSIPDACAAKGNVTATVAGNKITDCKGSGTLVIGRNVKKVSLSGVYIDDRAHITDFKVASGNKYFTAVNGVLFNKDKTELLWYPNARKNKSYTVKASTETVCRDAFSYNKYLENVTIKNGVKSIGDFAFSDSQIKSVSIPASINKIGASVFNGCVNLEEVQFKANVTSIPQSMFGGCKSLKAIDLPDYITQIGFYAFGACENLEVQIGKNVSFIGTDAFENAAVSFEVDKDNQFYKSVDGILYTKDGKTLEYYPCGRKGAYIMPDTVTGFREWAEPLSYNENITGITLGDGMKELYMNQLYGCTNLEEITLSGYTESIVATDRDYTVWGFGLKNLKNIIVPEDNKYYSAYEGNIYSKDYKKLCMVAAGRNQLTLHADVEKIPDGITGQNKFEKIELPNSNKYFTVKDNVLYDKEVARIIIFPGMVSSYEVPATVSDISVILNEYCTDWEDEGFTRRNDMAYNLESITAEENNMYFKSRDGVLFSKDMKELVLYPQNRKGAYTVPKSVTSYDAGIFTSVAGLTELVLQTGGMIDLEGCTSLKKLAYTEGVKGVRIWGHSNLENGLQLEEIYLPGTIRYLSLIRIGDNATVYGYRNTVEADYGLELFLEPFEDIKTYVTECGYKFKSLGKAPGIVKQVKAVKSSGKVKLTWNTVPGADGYTITYSPNAYGNYGEVTLKNIKDGKKKSCSIKQSAFKEKGNTMYVHIRAYKIIKGVKVYGKSASCKV